MNRIRDRLLPFVARRCCYELLMLCVGAALGPTLSSCLLNVHFPFSRFLYHVNDSLCEFDYHLRNNYSKNISYDHTLLLNGYISVGATRNSAERGRFRVRSEVAAGAKYEEKTHGFSPEKR